jgi:hypothetical protein
VIFISYAQLVAQCIDFVQSQQPLIIPKGFIESS